MPLPAFRLALVSWLLLIPACLCVWAKPGAPADPKSHPASGPRPAAARPAGPPRLDSLKIHSLYMDGEFDTAIAILEANLKEPRQYRHDDSVFIFKHLGVMYAAQFDTREKGKYYMHRLLTVEPTAKIMDMYASDMIYMIFRNIQEEYEQNRAYMAMQGRGRSGGDSLTAGSGPRAKKDSSGPAGRGEAPRVSGGKKWVWGGVAVATVAAGVGAYYLINGAEPKVAHKDFEY